MIVKVIEDPRSGVSISLVPLENDMFIVLGQRNSVSSIGYLSKTEVEKILPMAFK